MLYEKEIKQKKSVKALKSFACVILASCLMAFNIKTFVRAGEFRGKNIVLTFLYLILCLIFH